MSPITHALLPAVLASPFLARGRARDYYGSAAAVALAGLLPDLVNPHISLAARFASWSHTLFAFAGFLAVLLVMLFLRSPKALSIRLLLLMSLAYASHLLLDGISGGVACLYPASRQVYGVRLIRWENWLLVDAAVVLLCCVAFWWIPESRLGARWGWGRAESSGRKAEGGSADLGQS